MVDLQKTPKQFCDNILIGFTAESFAISLMNGETNSTYVLTPQHAKRLAQYVKHQIDEYEKQFGLINTPDWTPEVKSPYQIIPPQK